MSQESNKTDKPQDQQSTSDQIVDPKKARSSNKLPVGKSEQREARLAKALRDNLRRRKAGAAEARNADSSSQNNDEKDT